MRTWTLEERYRVLKNEDEIKDLYKQIKDSKYRQLYHIQPITGLLSDPNGFVHSDDKWHLFYQWCPWGAVHGLKYWYHVTSPDLVHWENEGVGLWPDTVYDNKGVHSGSAIEHDGTVYLFYTGNHRDEDWIRTPYTCQATFNESIEKREKPLFGPRDDYTEHQRDPKVIYDEDSGRYYMLIGAQNKDLSGCALVYSSETLDGDWRFDGELKVDGIESLGGMWECPNLALLGEKDLLIFSPQYINLPGRENSTNHSVYFLGKMDFDKLIFYPDKDYSFLDYGFDFYAAQIAGQSDSSNDPVLIGWIGLPDNHYPTEEEDWEGSLSLPRELRVDHDRLIQFPVPELQTLLEEPVNGPKLSKANWIKVKVLDDEDFYLNLFTQKGDVGGFRIDYHADSKKVVISKDKMEKRFNTQIGERLEIPFDKPIRKIDIFTDSNSIEIFFDGGEKTFTAHIYPTDKEKYFYSSNNLQVEAWTLKASNTNEFIL